MTNQKENLNTFEKAQDQFAAWHKTRKKRGPIPERLWDIAINGGPTMRFRVHKAKGRRYESLTCKGNVVNF